MKPTALGRRKFASLTPRQQHKILAQIAGDALVAKTFNAFFERYETLHGWAELDRYRPPDWLSAAEAVEECRAFHHRLAGLPEAVTGSQAKPLSWQPKHAVWVVVDQVRSPYNIGSVLRLIDNCALAGLVHGTSDLRLDHSQLKRSARGAQDWVPVRYEPDLPGFLQAAQVPVIAVDIEPGAVAVAAWTPPPACMLVLGNEAYGIATAVRACCHGAVYVPMWGYKHSMNLSHALAIIGHRIALVHD